RRARRRDPRPRRVGRHPDRGRARLLAPRPPGATGRPAGAGGSAHHQRPLPQRRDHPGPPAPPPARPHPHRPQRIPPPRLMPRAAVVGEREVAVAHVGDSRAYRLRGSELERLTTDHSLVGELVRRGKLTEEEAEEHPQKSVITRALGADPELEVETRTYPAQP